PLYPVAPRSARRVAGPGVRFHTSTVKPWSSNRSAMPAPMVPAPSSATRGVILLSLMAVPPSDRLGRGPADPHLLADDVFDPAHRRSIELKLGSRDRVIDVLGVARADDGDVD